jgi:hypothetical protein
MQTLTRCQQRVGAPTAGVLPRSSGRVSRVVRAAAARPGDAPVAASRREILSSAAAAVILPTLLAQQPAVAGGEPVGAGGSAMVGPAEAREWPRRGALRRRAGRPGAPPPPPPPPPPHAAPRPRHLRPAARARAMPPS